MVLDTTTEFGARVAKRLQEELIIWLTTVTPSGVPQPNPVWFLWQNDVFFIYTQPGTYKLRNIDYNPQVSLHFNSNAHGGDIVVFTGEAYVDKDVLPANQVTAYLEKYREGISRIQMTPESFAASYSVPLQVTPKRVRGF